MVYDGRTKASPPNAFLGTVLDARFIRHLSEIVSCRCTLCPTRERPSLIDDVYCGARRILRISGIELKKRIAHVDDDSS